MWKFENALHTEALQPSLKLRLSKAKAGGDVEMQGRQFENLEI